MANTEQIQPATPPADTPASDAKSFDEAVDERVAKRREEWMRSQLPMMRYVIIGLTVFFFLASAIQLAYLHYEIVNAPQRDFTAVDAMMQQAQGASSASEGQLPAAAIAALTKLEISAMERRYHQANVSLLTRTWTRYLGFVTGMVLAMVGATFILGRLETAPTTVKSEGPGWKGEVVSSSPGMVLAVLGVGLMLTTIVTHHEIQIQDRPIYAQGWSLGGGAPAAGNGEKAAPREFQNGDDASKAGGDDDMSKLLKTTREKLRKDGTKDDATSGSGSSLKR